MTVRDVSFRRYELILLCIDDVIDRIATQTLLCLRCTLLSAAFVVSSRSLCICFCDSPHYPFFYLKLFCLQEHIPSYLYFPFLCMTALAPSFPPAVAHSTCSRFDAAILAVHRKGERINQRIGDIKLQVGLMTCIRLDMVAISCYWCAHMYIACTCAQCAWRDASIHMVVRYLFSVVFHGTWSIFGIFGWLMCMHRHRTTSCWRRTKPSFNYTEMIAIGR